MSNNGFPGPAPLIFAMSRPSGHLNSAVCLTKDPASSLSSAISVINRKSYVKLAGLVPVLSFFGSPPASANTVAGIKSKRSRNQIHAERATTRCIDFPCHKCPLGSFSFLRLPVAGALILILLHVDWLLSFF